MLAKMLREPSQGIALAAEVATPYGLVTGAQEVMDNPTDPMAYLSMVPMVGKAGKVAKALRKSAVDQNDVFNARVKGFMEDLDKMSPDETSQRLKSLEMIDPDMHAVVSKLMDMR